RNGSKSAWKARYKPSIQRGFLDDHERESDRHCCPELDSIAEISIEQRHKFKIRTQPTVHLHDDYILPENVRQIFLIESREETERRLQQHVLQDLFIEFGQRLYTHLESYGIGGIHPVERTKSFDQDHGFLHCHAESLPQSRSRS